VCWVCGCFVLLVCCWWCVFGCCSVCVGSGVLCLVRCFGCWCVSPPGCFSCALQLAVGCSWFVCCSSGSFGGSWLGCVSPPLFHDPGCPAPGFVLIAECHLVGVAVWCFCSWRLCLWVVVCHPVGSSAPCFSCFVASCSSVCCSCFVSEVFSCWCVCYCVSSDLSVFVSVCVYCCCSCFSSWCCSLLLSVAVCV
jgi:hypothetical protein